MTDGHPLAGQAHRVIPAGRMKAGTAETVEAGKVRYVGPVELAKAFKDRIYHIHWKDLPAEWEEKRGKMWGCGMAVSALGDGVIDIAGVFKVLKDAPHVEYSTLEVAGDDNVKKSYEYLKSLGAE